MVTIPVKSFLQIAEFDFSDVSAETIELLQVVAVFKEADVKFQSNMCSVIYDIQQMVAILGDEQTSYGMLGRIPSGVPIREIGQLAKTPSRYIRIVEMPSEDHDDGYEYTDERRYFDSIATYNERHSDHGEDR